ncbi:MAG: ribose-5-phosphate isomerase RpiA [Waddliaceae bacterium]
MSHPSTSEQAIAKEAVGKAAADLIGNGMIVGLGTGTTAAYFISYLGKRCRLGLEIQAVTTSSRSLKQAREEKIPIIDVNTVSFLDIAVDGADEIDPQKRMIKGGGGALFREKVIANMSQEFLVIVDESKLVAHLGHFPLAVEISPFAYTATLFQLKKKGYPATVRKDSKGDYFLTDNGNYIADVQLQFPCIEPESDHEKISAVPGVIETGFFFNSAGRVLVGYYDKQIKILD